VDLTHETHHSRISSAIDYRRAQRSADRNQRLPEHGTEPREIGGI
jgi:hypothetical protein